MHFPSTDFVMEQVRSAIVLEGLRIALEHPVTIRPSIIMNVQKGPRPGADLVARAVVSFNKGIIPLSHPSAMDLTRDVLHAARRSLQNSPMIALMLVTIGGLLLITTNDQKVYQAKKGMSQCKGCASFYSLTRGKGLFTHQSSSQSLACSEAGLEREKNEGYGVVENEGEHVGSILGNHTNEQDSLAVISQKSHPSWRNTEEYKSRSVASSEIDEMLRSARDGNLDRLKQLVSDGCDVSQTKDRHGSGPLLWAAGSGHLDVCLWLVNSCGVEPKSTRRKDGRCALHWAARNGHLNVCVWLIEECGISADLATADGDTSFMFASWQGHLDLCHYLVDNCSVDKNAINRWGCNALFKAARMDGVQSTLEMFLYLMTLGVAPDLINEGGHSLFHKAAIYGRGDIIDILAQNSHCCIREHFLPDRTNQRPSDIAIYNGFPSVGSRLRHLEDILWCVPIVWTPPTPIVGNTESTKPDEAIRES